MSSLTLRRARGALLRLVLARRGALVSGTLLVGTALWLPAVDFPWETWLSDGFSLLLGATGAALLIAALGGRRPDWINRADGSSE